MHNKKIAAVAVTAAVALIATDYVKHTRKHKKIRQEIQLETEKEIMAIFHAEQVLRDRIQNGAGYTSIADIMQDFEFERIAARFAE